MDLETNKENLFDEDIDDTVIASPKTMINTKVIQAMKKLQASYNNNANKIIEEVFNFQVSKSLNFLIDLAMAPPNLYLYQLNQFPLMKLGII